jgi:dihydrofolate reductase
MPKRLRYQVAASLDGFIADPQGGYDWIVADATIDFGALYKEFDTAVMGRKTYDIVRAQGGNGAMPGIDVVVFSRTLPSTSSPGVRVVSDDPRKVVADVKAGNGRDVWLFGGGELFRYLLDGGLVDTVEVAVMPVLLGSGIPLLPAGAHARLVLSDLKRLPSGIVVLAYSVKGSKAAAPKIRYSKSSKGRKSKKSKNARKSRPARGKGKR